jgi:CRP/FNR family transcriptional regulator, cyclic AMP receptor protein
MLEFVGYLAAGLVFATFYMKTMIPLRLVGITSNVTFMVYAWFASVVPLFVLHCALLPLNVWRLMQIRTLLQEVRKVAVGDLPLESLLPFMTPRRAEAGEVLFRRGDAAGEMFHLLRGTVRLEELDKTLGPGAMLGEISMFAPRRERTGTAVCDTDVELLSITADKVMQLYYQNPRFGFHVVRLITGRLIENLRGGEPVSASNGGPGRDQELPEGGPVMGVARPAPPMLSAELRVRRRRRWLIGLCGAAAAASILLAVGWQLGPYLRSTVSRDAAVTTWIHVATSPIAGNLDSRLPKPGDRVGADGLIVTVRNRHNDPSAAEQSAGEVARAEAIVEELRRYVDAMRQLDAEWQARTASHAAAFKQNLEVTLTSDRLKLEQVKQQLEIARADLDRKQRLAARGNASVAAADEALASVAELELERVELERNIAELEVRRAAAEKGVFMTVDGTDPDWDDRSRDELRRHCSGRRRTGRGRRDAGPRSPCRRDRCLGPGAHERRFRHRTAGQSDLERHRRAGHGREHWQPDRRVARLLGDAGRRARERHRGGAAPAGNGGRGGARGRASASTGHDPAHPRLGRDAGPGRPRGPREGPLRWPGPGPVAARAHAGGHRHLPDRPLGLRRVPPGRPHRHAACPPALVR